MCLRSLGHNTDETCHRGYALARNPAAGDVSLHATDLSAQARPFGCGLGRNVALPSLAMVPMWHARVNIQSGEVNYEHRCRAAAGVPAGPSGNAACRTIARVLEHRRAGTL